MKNFTFCAVSVNCHSKTSQSCSRRFATEYPRGELSKSEAFLTASTLLGVKAKNVYHKTTKTHLTMKSEISQ